MLISAFAEVVSLGAVLPFIGILTSPDKVLSYPVVAQLAQTWSITQADQLELPITIVFVVAALVAGVLRILLLWLSVYLVAACGSELSVDVYRRILYQPYHEHVARNSSEVISSITNKVDSVVSGVILPLLILISSVLLLIAIMGALLAINPLVASVAALAFGISYGVLAWIARRRLHRNSQSIVIKETQRIKALQESLGGIRDVLLDGTQQQYSDIYRHADIPLRRTSADNNFISHSPRYAIETIGIILIAGLAYAMTHQVGGVNAALPLLGAMAIGAQRLLPALQQMYNGWASIAGSYSQLADIMEIADQPLPTDLLQPTPLFFKDAIPISAVSFRYTRDTPWILDGLTLNIPKGARVGFVGSTGAGKSTLLDLLMGLLIPTSGEILVDGEPVISPARHRAWQRSIAHVPQSIFLADASLAENIALGVPEDMIDLDRVRHAARQAQIADFIESSTEGYSAHVGERGISLSGGQRQRIGMARALYKKADVLVFDEATSALDTTTELAVMDAIAGLNRNLTILIIAHRLTTLRDCDFIVELEKGRVVRQDSYQNLLEASPNFRKSVQNGMLSNKAFNEK
ncbi:MAG: ABC transporter ATP-binding protein [Kordiimonadaceae bacterium]|nr:ABC transporter ATP-binding protein [Kordiimonadaceae bacterium]